MRAFLIQIAQVVAGGNGRGDRLDQLDRPSGIAVERDGAVLVADTFNNRVVRWRAGAQVGEVVAGGNGEGDRVDQLMRLSRCCAAVVLKWDPREHRLFPTGTRQLAKLVLLCLRRRAPKLEPQVLRGVLLPLLMEDAWVPPQELWDL